MRKFPVAVGLVLLTFAGCAPGQGVFAEAAPGYAPGYAPYNAPGYAPFYAPGYAPAYGYSFAAPAYEPPAPVFGNAFGFQFGGRRYDHDREREHHRHGEGDRYRRD